MVPGDPTYDLIERQGTADPTTRTYILRFKADGSEQNFGQITSDLGHGMSRIKFTCPSLGSVRITASQS